MLDFFRWLQGFVRFYIIGNSPERFINIVIKNRISIWNTQRENDRTSFSASSGTDSALMRRVNIIKLINMDN